MVIHGVHNYSIFSPADLKLERGLDVTQILSGGKSIHVDVQDLRGGGCKVLIGIEAIENPYFRC